jgi:hypothetical protein
MLAHSPPLPLAIDYRLAKDDDMAGESEEEKALLSSNMIVSVASASESCLDYLLRICKNSSWRWMMNIQFWNA